eukprot:2117024-Amphidinium_carterae.3
MGSAAGDSAAPFKWTAVYIFESLFSLSWVPSSLILPVVIKTLSSLQRESAHCVSFAQANQARKATEEEVLKHLVHVT